ncbi:MAG: hypothetical protein ABIQ44_10230 [Chloroflexia bacterium]
MASEAQIEANRSNAQLSTGPTSPEGKAKSAANARRHGLLSNSEIYFSPEEQNDYLDLESKLFKECLPGSELELQTFRRYTFNLYQLMRAQRMEVEAQEAALLSPESDTAFARMERMVKLAAILERRADKALSELRKLQRDRISSLEIESELYLLGQKIPIPLSLPIAEMRKTKQTQTSPQQLAMMMLHNTEEYRRIIEDQTKPIEDPEMAAKIKEFIANIDAQR